jgi:tRNA C32,U32 (ribose-2'-O)-methylase TrmJ
MGLDDLAAVELVAELAQRIEQATRVASDAGGVLSGAAVVRDSQATAL